MQYTNLTKVITLSDGTEAVVCSNYGTDKCLIHTQIIGCERCPAMGAMLVQLHEFEEAFAEMMQTEENEERDNAE